MDRSSVIATLRRHQDELRALGVTSISIFGSVARDEARAASDVDLAVRLSPLFASGGFAYFGRLEALRDRLSRLLGGDVDIVEEPVEAPRLQRQIDRDRLLAF